MIDFYWVVDGILDGNILFLSRLYINVTKFSRISAIYSQHSRMPQTISFRASNCGSQSTVQQYGRTMNPLLNPNDVKPFGDFIADAIKIDRALGRLQLSYLNTPALNGEFT